MNMWLMLGYMLLSGIHPVVVSSVSADGIASSQPLLPLMACRQETSPLVRLACYDNALSAGTEEKTDKPLNTGPDWKRAMAQEQKRTDHSTTFLVSEGMGDNPAVLITTPAIGIPPPRPVLMFSCIDNITRLQVALSDPQTDGAIKIMADNDSFDVHWFLRENGYLLESSRGLAGIDEIKRLMAAKTLTFDGPGSGFPRLTFNITSLAQVLKPLRNACHW